MALAGCVVPRVGGGGLRVTPGPATHPLGE